MIIFISEGSLGNQIFQYVFLKTINKKNEKIIVLSFEDLKEVFTINDFININCRSKIMKAILTRIFKPFFNLLTDRKLISSYSVNYDFVLNKYRRESTTYTKVIGKLKNITFVKLGFFQNERFFDKKITQKLKIKKKFLKKANIFLEKCSKNSSKVFIHIRRNDYMNFQVFGKNVIPSINYYKNQIAWFKKNKKNVIFIFLSDDLEFIKNEFKDINNKIIAKDNHFGIDFAIMTLCNNAILSPSSFGWWGSYLMKERDIIFAPRYWMGFNSGIDYGNSPSFTVKVDILRT